MAGFLIVAILVVSGAGYLIFASNQRTPPPQGVTSTTSGSSAGVTSLTLTADSTIPPTPNWTYQGLVSAVLNSSEVHEQIINAYYYTIARYGASPSSGNETQLFAVVYVIGAQTITGDWTTGYNETYEGQLIFNVTVQYTNPSTYDVTGTTIMSLANESNQISFGATQKQAIGIALANSTVKADIGGMAYFVWFADSQVNDSAAGYWVQLSQVNGYRNLGILVNSDLTEVVEVVTSTSYPNIGAP